MLALTFLLLLAAAAVVAPYAGLQDPNRPNLGTRLSPPSAEHWLGTDHYGRDVFSRTVWGARVSLTVGILAVALGAVIGVLLGLLAGFFGGFPDSVVSRIVDILLAFPLLLLALVLIAVLGSSITNVIIATGISTIPQFARVVRGAVLSIREREFVQASAALGASRLRTLLRHVLPNVTAPVIVMATVYTATVIILEANLGFLGFGVQPPEASWGSIVNDGRRYLAQAPWVSIVPSAAIFIAVLSFNIFGDGLRDALDPRLR
jgi:peptide/nickel transport system permease protein